MKEEIFQDDYLTVSLPVKVTHEVTGDNWHRIVAKIGDVEIVGASVDYPSAKRKFTIEYAQFIDDMVKAHHPTPQQELFSK